MLHKLLGFSAVLVLFLVLFPSSALCARGRLGLRRVHHRHAHHPLHRPIHSSKTRTAPTKMITAKVQGSPHEPNTFSWPPGHMAIPNNIEASTYADGESNLHIGVPTQVPNSIDMVDVPMSKPKTNGHVSDPTSPTMNKRSLLDPLSNYHRELLGGEDLTLLIASLTIQKDNNLFSMLPRGHRVPPSGPSKSHNSMITEKPT